MEQETDHTDNTMKLYERPQPTGRGRKDYRRQQTQKTGNSLQRHIGIHHMDTSKPPRDCHETEGYCIPQFRKTEGPSRQNTDGATTVHRVQLFAGHSHKACMANSFRECTEVASNKHVYSPWFCNHLLQKQREAGWGESQLLGQGLRGGEGRERMQRCHSHT